MPFANKKTSDKYYEHNCPLTFTHFDTNFLDNEMIMKGNKIGHSHDGIRFMAHTVLNPGETLFFRLDCELSNYPGPDSWDGFRTMAIAKVIRCRPIHDNSEFGFIVNVRYDSSEH
jgi:hypothetical protein